MRACACACVTLIKKANENKYILNIKKSIDNAYPLCYNESVLKSKTKKKQKKEKRKKIWNKQEKI